MWVIWSATRGHPRSQLGEVIHHQKNDLGKVTEKALTVLAEAFFVLKVASGHLVAFIFDRNS